jgi:hypothetical protein
MSIKEELEILCKQNNGFLRPQEVVEFARNPDTALHTQFEWDDGAAAEKYRLAQARAIIRVAVIVNPDNQESVRAYVSLTDERDENGGYRALAEVLSDEILKDKMLSDALKDLQTFQRKYNRLKDIAEIGIILDAIDGVMPSAAESKVA